MSGTRAKKLQDKKLDGGLLTAMLDSVVKSLNESDIVSIPDMWTTMVTRAAEEALDKVCTSLCKISA